MADLKPSTPPTTTTVLDEKLTNADADPAQLLDEHDLTAKPLPYWLVNVPRSEWTTECPSFLRDLPERLIESISTPDEQFRPADWARVKEIVQMNRMDLFGRVPSNMRKYIEKMDGIKAEYSSIMRFIIKERVCWGDDFSDIQPRGKPFEYDEDIRILYNDWPYGIDPDIVHLVVWVKFPFEEEPITGEITANTRVIIESYVQRKFEQVPSEKLMWFRNPTALKSVLGLDHFHVMLYQPDMEFVREITRGDVPMIERE